jgi:hypothetical protein
MDSAKLLFIIASRVTTLDFFSGEKEAVESLKY